VRGKRTLVPTVFLLSLGLGCACGSGAAPGAGRLGTISPQHEPLATRTAGGVAAPTATTASPVCDAPGAELAKSLGPTPPLPSHPVQLVVTPPGGVETFSASGGTVYVDTGTRLVTYSLSGQEKASFALPASMQGTEISGPVIGPHGSIYLSNYYGRTVERFSGSGRLLWTRDPAAGNPTGIYAISTSGQFRLAVSITQNHRRSLVLNRTGKAAGSFPLVDDFGYVSTEANGDLLYAAKGYVDTLNPRGHLLSRFGARGTSGRDAHTGGPYQFFYTGQAVEGPDGTIYTADPLSTIEATSAQGFLQDATTLGGSLDLGGSGFQLAGNRLFFQSGPPFDASADSISSVSLATLSHYLAAPQAPLDSLGWGAGIDTPAAGNYFMPGDEPVVTAAFDPWWHSVARLIELTYSIQDAAEIASEDVPVPTVVHLPTNLRRLASIPLRVPRSDREPGPYEVQARLYDLATSPPTLLGTTCLTYTVGAPGDRLNLATLPPGAGAGGPSDPRGVVLNSELGLDGFRGQPIDWSTFLPNCNPSAPTAATCSSTAMTFAHAPTSYFQAAGLALADHVTYWVQITGGGEPSLALVDNGWWQGDIEALVRYYSSPPSACGSCAAVTAWEPWNEPNNTGWPDATQYVSEVLAPFATAVRAAAPSDTIIGGSTIGFPFSWWRQFIAAGGLADLTVASVHPYTGNNDSFEEWGTPGKVHRLEQMLGKTPLWFTEVGWWSDGPFNFLHQANAVARAMLWQKALDVAVWGYFFDEGSWGNDGVSFSLIQTSSGGDDFVKPAALAAMTASSAIGDRPYLATISTGIPHVYAMSFGAVPEGSTDLTAVWSDGLATDAVLTAQSPTSSTVPVKILSEYGASVTTDLVKSRAYRLPVTAQVTYLSYPATDSLLVRPTVPFGTDVALSAEGARASASSGDASAAITGTTTGAGWTSAPGDELPWITVRLRHAEEVDRVMVDTQSVGSTAPGLRDYSVLIEQPGGQWKTAAIVTGQYRYHVEEVLFAPERVLAVKVSVSVVNYGGYYGGVIPPFWPATLQAPAIIHAIEIYTGPAPPAQVRGAGLVALPTP